MCSFPHKNGGPHHVDDSFFLSINWVSNKRIWKIECDKINVLIPN